MTTPAQLHELLATATGSTPENTTRFLTELAKVAYENVSNGFVLPGFGRFHLVPGPVTTGINPFTNEPMVFRARPEVSFTLDTVAKKAFLAGHADEIVLTDGEPKGETLIPIDLTPNVEQAVAAGVALKRATSCRCKLGGEPEWIQGPETPVCCGQPMMFYAQLDSLDGPYVIGGTRSRPDQAV